MTATFAFSLNLLILQNLKIMLTILQKTIYRQRLILSASSNRSSRLFFRCGLIILLSCLQACQSTKNNETSYDYTWKKEVFQEIQPKRIIISHVNLGAPSRSYLTKHESKIDNIVKARLIEAGFELSDQQKFKSLWRGAVRKHGEPYDKETGQGKVQVLEAILFDVLSEVEKENLADAVLFTDLVERNVILGGRNEKRAQWDGVSRGPKLSSPGSVPEDFNWNQPMSAVSLMAVLYSSDQRFLFKSAGGLEITRAIDTRNSKARLVRREKMLSNNKHINEGVALALHPLVVIDNYVEH